jgi:hypothetical protein
MSNEWDKKENEFTIGEKEMTIIKDHANRFWQSNTEPMFVQGREHSLQHLALIEGTITLLNQMGLLNKLPVVEYTNRKR